MSYWTDGYAAAADVELVMNSEKLPPRSHTLSMNTVVHRDLQLCEMEICVDSRDANTLTDIPW